MKKLLTVIATAIFIVYPFSCFASYVIHLKDGREFVTDRYYEEGDQIKFKRYGGVIGIQKDLIREIEEKEDVPEEKAEPAKPETPSEAKTGDRENSGVKESGTPKSPEPSEDKPEKNALKKGVTDDSK
ncbi:MAG: YgdI/YgdR family lipoprotein, partial [Desulfobacteraceae bacterium]|nr:YgdI/YgdR family lipoprotein [Desulfobacteraceae bacterium]